MSALCVGRDFLKSVMEKRYRPCLRYPKSFLVRTTEDEWEKLSLRARRSELSLSRFLVRLGTEERPPPTREERHEFLMLLTELRMVGVNLHQIARCMNVSRATGKKIPISVDELLSSVSAVKALTHDLRRCLSLK